MGPSLKGSDSLLLQNDLKKVDGAAKKVQQNTEDYKNESLDNTSLDGHGQITFPSSELDISIDTFTTNFWNLPT
eukprot:Awhi_evm2s12832